MMDKLKIEFFYDVFVTQAHFSAMIVTVLSQTKAADRLVYQECAAPEFFDLDTSGSLTFERLSKFPGFSCVFLFSRVYGCIRKGYNYAKREEERATRLS